MVILGIDPGIGRTGWGVIDVQSSIFKVKSFGCIETSKDSSIAERLELLYNELINIIKEFKPDSLAIEELFFNTNVSTALVVGQARGIVFLQPSSINFQSQFIHRFRLKLVSQVMAAPKRIKSDRW